MARGSRSKSQLRSDAGLVRTYIAGGAGVTAGRLVSPGAGRVVSHTAAAGASIGIALNTAAAGGIVKVRRLMGVYTFPATSGAIAAGGALGSAANGLPRAAAVADYVFGVAGDANDGAGGATIVELGGIGMRSV